MSDVSWEQNLQRKLTKKYLSPNAVRDGFIESYCLLLKNYQTAKGAFTSEADLNQKTFSMVRDIYRENDIHYEIPPKSVILYVDGLVRSKINLLEIEKAVPEPFREHERVCRELLLRLEE
ncbi:MAG TPA: hypothetical protein VN944_05125 [Nitrospiria bacterium]|nr:hypothetical protein [Nitrospiria bacterium]